MEKFDISNLESHRIVFGQRWLLFNSRVDSLKLNNALEAYICFMIL